jgi:hypothetical protein
VATSQAGFICSAQDGLSAANPSPYYPNLDYPNLGNAATMVDDAAIIIGPDPLARPINAAVQRGIRRIDKPLRV